MKSKIIFLSCAVLLFLGSCNRLNGTYTPGGHGFLGNIIFAASNKFEKVILSSGNKAQVIAYNGVYEGSYFSEGNKVKINLSGDAEEKLGAKEFVFIVDNEGCLDGGASIGKYCKQ